MKSSNIIKLIIIAAMVIILLSVILRINGKESPGKNRSSSVKIIVATDLHYIASDLTDHGEYFQNMLDNGDGKIIHYIVEITDAFIEEMLKEAPDALILTGDTTFNGAKRSHIELAEKLKRLTDEGITVLTLPGNHDLYSSNAASFSGDSFEFVENTDSESFESIYRDFGYGDALASDKYSSSYIYQLTDDLRILLVDVNTKQAPGWITQKTLEWVEDQLIQAAEDEVKVIAASHQTVLEHSSQFSFGFVMGNNEKLLALYEQYGVIMNLSGHMHIQHISQSKNGFTEIVTSALSVTPVQYGVIELNEREINYHTRATDLSSVRFEGNDENFPYRYFWNLSYEKVYGQIEDETDAPSLAEFFADVNTAYFTGTVDSIDWDDPKAARWKEMDLFVSRYFSSIEEERGTNHNTLSISFE